MIDPGMTDFFLLSFLLIPFSLEKKQMDGKRTDCFED